MVWENIKQSFKKLYNDGEDEEYEDEGVYDESGFTEMPSYEESVENDRRQQHAKKLRTEYRDENNVVKMATTAILQVVLSQPERFEDARTIADNLNNKRTVVLNLEKTPKDVARRLVDFLSGVAYANNGQLKKVANNTVIITPYNVDVSGDLLDELENTGVFF